MKTAARAVLAAVWILMASSLSWGADVAFTANVKALAGGNGNPAIGVKVQNCSNYILRVPAPAVLIGDTAYLFPDGNGLVSNTVPDEVTIGCGSTASAAYYTVTIVQWDPVKHAPILPAARFNDYDITGSSFNLNTATPRSAPAPAAIANAVLTNPAGNQTIAQPVGSLLSVAGLGGVDNTAAGITRPFARSAFASFPSSCAALKDMRIRTDPSVAGQVLYQCNAAGTGWDLVGDGGSGGGGGITSLNSQTGATQTFTNDTNVTISSATNAHAIVWQGALIKGRQHAATVYNDQANVYTAGMKQTVQSSASTAGFNLAGVAADPSGLAAGDHWYRTDLDHLRYRGQSAVKQLFNSDDTLPYSQVSSPPQLANTLATVAHKWLNSYNAITGNFTQTQPDYSDIANTPTLFYQTIKQAGSAQTQRAILNFTAGMTCSDNSGTGATDCAVNAGGTGTVTQVTSGNFSPLFNVSVATNTTTPAFSFAAINQNQNLIYSGPGSGSAAAPTFRSLVKLDLPATTVYTDQANTFGSFLQTLPQLALSGISAHLIPVSQAGSQATGIPAGTAGQIMQSNGAGADPSFVDPIISKNFATLINAGAATAQVTGSAVRLSTLSTFGTLYVTFASITGSPVGCTIQLKNVDNLGNAINNGSTIAVSPANGTTTVAVNPAAGLQTADQMSALFNCATTYPTAGTVSVVFTPGESIGAMQVAQLPAALDGSGGVKTHEVGTAAISAVSLPLPALAATSTKQSDGSQKTQIVDASGNVASQTANAVDVNLKSGSIPAGANNIGKVGLDPTTPGTTNGVTNYQPTRTTGTITSTTCPGSGCVSLATTGYGVATVTVNGTYAGVTAVFEFSDDGGTNWYPTTASRTDSATLENSNALTANKSQAWDVSVYAASNLRVRASAYTSGTANIGITLSSAPIEAALTAALAAGTASIGTVGLNTGSNSIGTVGLNTGTNSIGSISNFPATVDVNAGNLSANTPRVTLATDSATNTNPFNTQGKLTDNGAAATGNMVGVLPAVGQAAIPASGTAGRNMSLLTDLRHVLAVGVLPVDFPSFSASKLGLVSVASATDIACIPGNATNTVIVTRVQVSGTQTTAGIVDLALVQRTTANTGGTSATITQIKNDVNNGSAVTVPLSYTANPTLNSTVGNYDSYKLGVLAPGTASPDDVYIWKPSMGQSIVLRGTAQEACVNLNGVTVTGGNFNITFGWMEIAGY